MEIKRLIYKEGIRLPYPWSKRNIIFFTVGIELEMELFLIMYLSLNKNAVISVQI